MTYFTTAASAAIAAAVLALIALAALHILKPEVSPSRNMISQYALGRHGWVMALFFGAFAAASACLSAALSSMRKRSRVESAWRFSWALPLGWRWRHASRWTRVGTPRERVSFSGKMHGVAFLVGVPCQLLAVVLLSLACTVKPPTRLCRS